MKKLAKFPPDLRYHCILALHWVVTPAVRHKGTQTEKSGGGGKPSGDNSASCSTFGRRDHNDVASKLHTCIVRREQWIHKVASYRLCVVCASTLPSERRTLHPSVAANEEARRFLPKFVTIFSLEAGKLPPPSRETRIVLLGSRIRKVGQHSGVICYCQSVQNTSLPPSISRMMVCRSAVVEFPNCVFALSMI